MKIIHAVYGALILASLGFNVYNYNRIDQKMPSIDIPQGIYKNRYNFLHKVLSKEPLRKYTYVLNKPEFKGEVSNPYPNKSWFYWSEGIDKAPDITPVCLKSIKKYIPNMEVICLDKHNIKKYIKLPEHILEKHKRGIISETHFSDIVRVYLLKEYGGLWIDCTTYLSGTLPKDIFEADFFAPSFLDIEPDKFNFNDTVTCGVFCNCFMYAKKPHNYIVERMADFLTEYWKDKNWCDYFVFYEFATVAMEEDEKFFNKIMYMLKNHCYPESLFLGLSNIIHRRYNKNTWKKLKNFPIHKISLAVNGRKKYKAGSYFDKLAKGEL